jgi:hypothetical protein
VHSHHWVEAGQLQPGDKVETVTGDLTIDRVHTYYVLAGKRRSWSIIITAAT